MNRADFMKSLTELLSDVPPSEREEAIQYYNDYFDDAGPENEQSVIAALGSPKQLAQTIKAGLADGGDTGEYTEKGFYGYGQRKSDEVMDISKAQGENKSEQSYRQAADKTSHRQDKKRISGGMLALIIILCIFASPFLIAIAASVIGVIIAAFGCIFALVVSVGAAAIFLCIGGVCLFAYGIAMLFVMPFGGLALMGTGMILAALGIFCLWLTVCCGMLVPVIIRAIVGFFNHILHKGGVKA